MPHHHASCLRYVRQPDARDCIGSDSRCLNMLLLSTRMIVAALAVSVCDTYAAHARTLLIVYWPHLLASLAAARAMHY